jgi:hypothetical protein
MQPSCLSGDTFVHTFSTIITAGAQFFQPSTTNLSGPYQDQSLISRWLREIS